MGDDDVIATCPHYLAAQPFVLSCTQYLSDYKRGTMGNTWDLPAVLFEALEVLEVEDTRLDRWLKEQELTVYGH